MVELYKLSLALTIVKINTTYKPREQQKLIHKAVRDNRFNVVVAHRRMGKTVSAINQLIHSALISDLKKPRFAYIAPTYTQAKRITWDYLLEYTRPLQPQINSQELSVSFRGRKINLYGADGTGDSLRGIYLDGCIIDEIANINPSMFYDVIRPALTDRKGWCMFIGTPKGNNHFKDLRDRAYNKEKGWNLLEFKASDTNLIDEEELTMARNEMGENKYSQEFECSFDSAIEGAYYGNIINDLLSKNHIREIPHEAVTSRWSAWDLGIGDSTTIWIAEVIGGEVRIMDYYENHGEALDHYVEWIKDNGYMDCTHILPHDVRVRELGTGKSRLEVLESAGMNIEVCRQIGVEDGIQAVRRMLPNCYFNKKTTEYGLNCLRNYRRTYNEKLNVYQEKPLHDWTSHAADAFRYLAVGLDLTTNRTDWSKPLEINKQWIV